MATLNGEQLLLTLSALGLGFGGFSGLIITLRQEPTSRWSPIDLAALKFVLEHSLGLVLLSLIPSLLSQLVSERFVWQIGTFLLSAAFAIFVFVQLVRIRRLKDCGAVPPYPQTLIRYYMLPTGILSILLAYQTYHGGSLFWYSSGLVYLLFVSMVQFWIALRSSTTSQ